MEKKWPVYTAIICLEDNDKIDINNFRPEVESPNKDMYDNRAIYEIRILDGDLFYVISNSEGKHQIQPKNRVAIAAALNLIIPNCTNL